MIFKRPKKFPLLPRNNQADKSSFGHVLVVAGSEGLMGAGALASRAALQAGAGLVTWALPASLQAFAFPATHEIMRLPIRRSIQGEVRSFTRKRKVSAILLGPGLSVRPEAVRSVRRLYASLEQSIVLDADGLNAFGDNVSALKKHAGERILTPHKAEFERLFRLRWPATQSARVVLAKKLSAFYDVTLVLKGHKTIVASSGRVYVNNTGNPGMAKGGSGDVLSGIIAAFLAQGLSPFEATVWAVYYHGLAGDLAVKKKSQLSLNAGDLVEYLPVAFLKNT